ncbi:MAG: TlpA disulfide reductase family protein [Bacteroidota bacterium]
MKKISIFFIVFFVFINIINAQNVIITGNAKTYVGDTLYWKTYSDQITFTEKLLGKSKVDNNGNFRFELMAVKPIISFVHLNVFKGILYLEPGKSYNIVLPKKVTKLPEDELNPFFEETEFFVKCTNIDSTDLNYMIKKFDELYDLNMTKSFKQFRGKVSKPIIDSIIQLIEKEFPESKNKYFNNYKEFNYSALRLVAYERNKRNFINKYFANQEILFNNPAYMDLFNRVFNNHLSVLYKDPKGKIIPYNLIKQKSLSNLKSTLDSFPYLTNDTLQDMVILKSLYDNFYKDDFPRESILFMVDSIELATSISEIKVTAKNIKSKLTTLLPGYTAPNFKLKDINGKLVSLEDFKDEFVYLNICTPASYSCQKDFKTLQQLNNQQHELLNVVTICVCNSFEEMKQLVKENKFNWTFLYYEKNEELIKDYNVRVYPSYYLINPEGKLVMSPAFPPTEASFEARYFDALKSWKKELQRRETEKKEKGLGQE